MPSESEGFADEGWGTDRDLASLPGGPPDAAMLDRIAEMAGITEDAPPSEPTMDLLETAWGIIANAGWDGMAQTPGWQEAAVRWRDRYHEVLREFCASRPTPVPSAAGYADGTGAGAGTEDGMYKRAYWDVQRILDDAIGTEAEGGAGEGLASDVALLAARCKAAESEVMRLKGVTVLPGMPGAEL